MGQRACQNFLPLAHCGFGVRPDRNGLFGPQLKHDVNTRMSPRCLATEMISQTSKSQMKSASIELFEVLAQATSRIVRSPFYVSRGNRCTRLALNTISGSVYSDDS